MRKFAIVVPCVLGLVLCACATGYQPSSFTGGYTDTKTSQEVWTIRYGGNGFTTAETVQTFWLFHTAELTLAQGYNGFRILSPLDMASGRSTTELPVDLGLVGKPSLTLSIMLLKNPFVPKPPVVFDAAALKARLEPLVKGGLCEGNVCPHVHTYLMPDVSR
jgi:hypothetical protein